MAGTNDLFQVSVRAFERRYNELLDAVSDSLPQAQIYLQSILPMNNDLKFRVPSDEKIREANELIRKIANWRGVKYIDLYSLYVKEGKLPDNYTKDGIHLKPEYYDRWYGALREYLTPAITTVE